MSAFNDYCVVCDQLIPQSPESSKNACAEKRHACCLDRLYCSDACRQKDKHLIKTRLEALELSNHSCNEAVDDPESLIKSPLLIPMDHCQGEYDSDGERGSYCLRNMVSSSTVSIPRLSLKPSSPSSRSPYDSINLDHIAEKNYQLWLNQNH